MSGRIFLNVNDSITDSPIVNYSPELIEFVTQEVKQILSYYFFEKPDKENLEKYQKREQDFGILININRYDFIDFLFLK